MGGNQATSIVATAEIERAVIDLVGDLASYSPRSKVVFMEGTVDGGFDVQMVSCLFPEFAERVNLVSMGNKARVKRLQDALARAAADGRIDARFFCIVDRDFEPDTLSATTAVFSWDRYHIENYLLQPEFIWEAHRALDLNGAQATSTDEVEVRLRRCASETIQDIVRIKLDEEVNSLLMKTISMKHDRTLPPSAGIADAVKRSLSKFHDAVANDLHLVQLQAKEQEITDELQDALNGEEWLRLFRGRDLLKRYVSRYVPGVQYEPFRNLVLARTKERRFQPLGMATVIDRILDA